MKNIKLLFMDVDGTLTDGKIYMGNDGEVCKAFDIKDGCGIHDILPQYDIIPVIITARESKIVENRCKELGIELLFQNCRNKRAKMIEVASQYRLSTKDNGIIEGTAYIGDDILDLPCMEIAEINGCPKDAVSAVKEKGDFVSQYNGGAGAVREFIEWLCNEYLLH